MLIIETDLERCVQYKMARLLISIDDVVETHRVCLVVERDPSLFINHYDEHNNDQDDTMEKEGANLLPDDFSIT